MDELVRIRDAVKPTDVLLKDATNLQSEEVSLKIKEKEESKGRARCHVSHIRCHQSATLRTASAGLQPTLSAWADLRIFHTGITA